MAKSPNKFSDWILANFLYVLLSLIFLIAALVGLAFAKLGLSDAIQALFLAIQSILMFALVFVTWLYARETAKLSANSLKASLAAD